MHNSKREQWATRVAAWEASGCSQVAWCREQGLSLASLGYWRRKLAAQSQPAVPATLPIRVVSSASVPSIEVRLPGGVSLSVPAGDPRWLVSLLRALGAC